MFQTVEEWGKGNVLGRSGRGSIYLCCADREKTGAALGSRRVVLVEKKDDGLEKEIEVQTWI